MKKMIPLFLGLIVFTFTNKVLTMEVLVEDEPEKIVTIGLERNALDSLDTILLERQDRGEAGFWAIHTKHSQLSILIRLFEELNKDNSIQNQLDYVPDADTVGQATVSFLQLPTRTALRQLKCEQVHHDTVVWAAKNDEANQTKAATQVLTCSRAIERTLEEPCDICTKCCSTHAINLGMLGCVCCLGCIKVATLLKWF